MNLEDSVIGNRYKIIEKIGNGGMATVYRALDQILNRYVAVKVLREEFTTDEEFIRRFNAEAQSAARLTHPNIVSVYDVGQEDNVYYIVMELIQGKTLKEIIDEDKVLPWKWSVNIAIQIASALEMAHKNHIVHRDIKPHNIMITEDGVAKVTDFGIGTTIGSVHYFSPEHARGGYTDSKSDLYSLGVVMYEMVTGKVPFDADTPVSVALKHMQDDPIEPIKENKDVPFAVNQIIMKAMKKNPQERYQNASELIKDLQMALKKPEGGFVEDRNFENGFTQRIPTMESFQAKRAEEDDEEEYYDDDTFFARHPKAKVAIIISCIVLVLGLIAAVPIVTMGIFNSKTEAQNVQIPNFVGLTLDEAKQRAEESKVELKIEEAYSADVEKDHIISQKPDYAANYSIKQGSEITITVSKGKETVKMPKVAGMEYDEAERVLKKLGLKIEKIEEISQKVEEGYVISQEVDEDEDIEVGETVKIHVSTGNGIKKVTVKQVVGKSEGEAKSILTDELNLEVNIVNEEDTSKSDGIVLKQSIEEGSVVEEGSPITITVNKIQPTKEATLIINVKSLADKYLQKEESDSSESGKNKDSQVRITVYSGKDKVYGQTVARSTKNLEVPIKGKGTVTVKVWIADSNESTDGIRAEELQIDLNSRTEVTVD